MVLLALVRRIRHFALVDELGSNFLTECMSVFDPGKLSRFCPIEGMTAFGNKSRIVYARLSRQVITGNPHGAFFVQRFACRL